MPKAIHAGIELEYDQFGPDSGQPLLLIMGLGAQMVLWDEGFCEKLAERGPSRGSPWVFNITPILGRYARTQLVCPIPLSCSELLESVCTSGHGEDAQEGADMPGSGLLVRMSTRDEAKKAA